MLSETIPPSLRDPARVALQSAVAAGLTYLLCLWLELGERSWALISALFVLQQNADATMTAALGRIGGTVLGTLVGIASILALGGEAWVLARVVIAAVVLNAIAAKKPELRYGVVAATIIALETDPDLWGGALARGAAIMIGTLVGTAAALFVWPESAAKRTIRAVRAALASCRELLNAELGAIETREDRNLAPIHDRLLAELRVARALAGNARLRRHVHGVSLDRLVHALSRFWHALVIIDRLLARDAPRAGRGPELDAAIERVRRRACVWLDAEAKGDGSDALAGLDTDIDGAITAARRAGPPARAEPLAFSLGELARNLHEIDALMEELP